MSVPTFPIPRGRDPHGTACMEEACGLGGLGYGAYLATPDHFEGALDLRPNPKTARIHCYY